MLASLALGFATAVLQVSFAVILRMSDVGLLQILPITSSIQHFAVSSRQVQVRITVTASAAYEPQSIAKCLHWSCRLLP